MKTPPSQKRNSDVQAARGRLRGALNDSLQSQEVDDIPEDYEEEEEQQVVQHRPQRGRPKKIRPPSPSFNRVHSLSPTSFLTPSKRRKRERELAASGHGLKIQAESFVMKLFDRSLDLSKYTEQTSLYPICRAWMANQPRNPCIRSYRDARSPSPSERKDNGTELSQLRTGDNRDVSNMPRPKKSDVPKVPPPQEEPKKYDNTEDLIKPDDTLKDAKKEDLLTHHLSKWKQIKTDWQKHTRVYQQRNELNFTVLQELFKP